MQAFYFKIYFWSIYLNGLRQQLQDTLSIKEHYEQLSQETSVNIYSAITGQHIFCI